MSKDVIKIAKESLENLLNLIQEKYENIDVDLIDNVELPADEKDTRDRFMRKYFKVNRFKNKHNDYEGLENAGKISWRFLSKHSYLMNE